MNLILNGPLLGPCPKPSFGSLYLDANGITVKAPEDAEIGSKGMVNGIEYTVVDDETLRGLIANGEDVTTVCTSRITDMSAMFGGPDSFSQDISAWDVSNVTTMENMFYYGSFNQDLSAWDGAQCDNYEWYVFISLELQSRPQCLGCAQCDNYEWYVFISLELQTKTSALGM